MYCVVVRDEIGLPHAAAEFDTEAAARKFIEANHLRRAEVRRAVEVKKDEEGNVYVLEPPTVKKEFVATKTYTVPHRRGGSDSCSEQVGGLRCGTCGYPLGDGDSGDESTGWIRCPSCGG